MQSAIVTGGLGFIGSHLVELLIKKKFKDFIIDNYLRFHKQERIDVDSIYYYSGRVLISGF